MQTFGKRWKADVLDTPACCTGHCSSSSTLLCAMGDRPEWTASRGIWRGSAGDWGMGRDEVSYLFILLLLLCGAKVAVATALTWGIADAAVPHPGSFSLTTADAQWWLLHCASPLCLRAFFWPWKHAYSMFRAGRRCWTVDSLTVVWELVSRHPHYLLPGLGQL